MAERIALRAAKLRRHDVAAVGDERRGDRRGGGGGLQLGVGREGAPKRERAQRHGHERAGDSHFCLLRWFLYAERGFRSALAR
jgi:hypothetical protein